ncbi:alpha-ketoacid dehydrogenase kinase [Rhizoclosmatium globosum]|uniref:Protein-serine/threonine kinase n=1 Tax=Rhizoclosmatium globosum TaxID=329046 RepID=A0A1Y2BVE3_9FUNG|nr:alpha-ketoacid dehydrogenase kinase [Rhizoclosmatium globosum]|eukprot:ORY38703.1 alpha-ketoacid dehydrogenase kinase [Rhizoclosmatium globosum]
MAAAPINPVTLKRLLDLGESKNLRESSLLLHSELPKRLARRVKGALTAFIVGVNPHIRGIYQLLTPKLHQLLDSFDILSQLPEPRDEETEKLFTLTLKDLVHSHGDVIPDWRKVCFQECGKYMSKEDAADFLDGMIHARIAIRVLAEHHLALQEPIPGYIGVLNTSLSPTSILRQTADYVEELCEINYGVAPEHLDTRITYISNHLEYIFMELLKNASRATVEHSRRISRKGEQPPVLITVARGPEDVTIRLGFGLPMSRIYAKYFGGSLDLKSVGGHGLDVFLRVPNISRSDSKLLI